MGVIFMVFKSEMDMLSGKNVMEKGKQEKVMVNINRIYEKMALAMRSVSNEEERNKIVNIQKKALEKSKSGKEMFVPMTVDEVNKSFGKNLDKLPYNTFRGMKSNR